MTIKKIQPFHIDATKDFVFGNLTAQGLMTVVGNANIGNIDSTGVVATTLGGLLTTSAQPNITSVGLLSALSVGPNSSITLTGSSGFVKANSIQGTDGVNAIYPGYNGVTGAVGITSNLTVGIGVAGNITANGTVNFTNASNVSLGAVGNVKITGGTTGQYLTTDGSGNLSFSAISSTSISNGDSNVNIPTANGNVTISSAGTANVVVVSSTSANVTGELNVSGNVTSNGIRLGYLGAPLSGSDKTTSYTLATPTDLGKIVIVGTGGSIIIPNSTFSAGDTIGLYNNTAATVTVTCSTTNAYIAGTDTNKTSVTLAARGLATIAFISSTLCVISGSVT